jgi:hypothetical protein
MQSILTFVAWKAWRYHRGIIITVNHCYNDWMINNHCYTDWMINNHCYTDWMININNHCYTDWMINNHWPQKENSNLSSDVKRRETGLIVNHYKIFTQMQLNGIDPTAKDKDDLIYKCFIHANRRMYMGTWILDEIKEIHRTASICISDHLCP